MDEYIEREAFIESQQHLYCKNCARRKDGKGKFVYDIGDAPCRACEIMDVLDAVADFPAADVVSHGAYDQTDWERCVALTQLKEIGKGFGERMDDVRPVVRGKWIPDYDYAEYDFDGITPLSEPLKFQDGWQCSLCGRYMLSEANFCPNCGADMREES